MPIKRDIVGTGLTKFKRETVSGHIGKKEKAAIDRMVARHNKTRGSFDAMAAPIEREAKAILEEAGGKPGEIQSQSWYAHQIDWRIGAIRAHIEKDEAELAAMRSLELGHFHYEALFKDLWEPRTITGQKSYEATRRGVESRDQYLDLTDDRRVAAYNKHRGQGLPIGKAKEEAAKDTSCRARTISRAIERVKRRQ